jgi:hypothetical protein
MYRKWTFKYSIAAALAAVAIIAISLFANPTLSPIKSAQAANFAVMLTDPPTVPAGTTQLNLTYNSVMLHVIDQNGTAYWLPVTASGTVNLFSLVNMTQTIASTTIPVNSTIDKVQFTIANVTADVNSKVYNVTALSDTFVVKVANGAVNQTLSGVLIEFNPTLVQIQASDANSTTVYYYVLVPSANAMIVNNVNEEHLRIGTIVKIGENNRVTLEHVKEGFSKNVTIVSATLAVKGNNTALSVTLQNQGNVTFRIFGLSLNGEFNVTQSSSSKENERDEHGMDNAKVHPDTIPFKVSGTSLVPVFGTDQEHDEDDRGFSSVTLQPGDSVTLSFSGVIAINAGWRDQNPVFSLVPIVDGNYTLRLTGEGFQTFMVKATPQP